jgi:hypothetical protein
MKSSTKLIEGQTPQSVIHTRLLDSEANAFICSPTSERLSFRDEGSGNLVLSPSVDGAPKLDVGIPWDRHHSFACLGVRLFMNTFAERPRARNPTSGGGH